MQCLIEERKGQSILKSREHLFRQTKPKGEKTSKKLRAFYWTKVFQVAARVVGACL